MVGGAPPHIWPLPRRVVSPAAITGSVDHGVSDVSHPTGTVVDVSATDDSRRQHAVTRLAAAVDDAPDALSRLSALRALQDAAAELERVTVETAQAAGVSWGQLGRALSRSKQSVCRKYGPKPEPQEDAEPVRAQKVNQPKVWGELRVGPGRGVRAGHIVRRS